MGVVHEAVEDGIGIGRVADHLVPFVDRDLAGEDGRAAAVTFFEYLVEIAAGGGSRPQSSRMRSWAPLRLRMMRACRPSPRARARSANSLGTRW